LKDKENWIQEAQACLKLRFPHHIKGRPEPHSIRFYRTLCDAVRHTVCLNAFRDHLANGEEFSPRTVISSGLEIRIRRGHAGTPFEIFHREIHEAVMDLLTVTAHPSAVPHFASLLPFAREIGEGIGLDRLADDFFARGYKGLVFDCFSAGVDLASLEHRARSVLSLSRR
jgi:hypothetical protein